MLRKLNLHTECNIYPDGSVSVTVGKRERFQELGVFVVLVWIDYRYPMRLVEQVETTLSADALDVTRVSMVHMAQEFLSTRGSCPSGLRELAQSVAAGACGSGALCTCSYSSGAVVRCARCECNGGIDRGVLWRWVERGYKDFTRDYGTEWKSSGGCV